MSVQQAYNDINKIKMVVEDDVKALITFINSGDNCYSQLGEVNQLSSITLSHADDLCDKLPLSVRKRLNAQAFIQRQKACFRCFGSHMKSNCEVQHLCKTCALDHHELICFQENTSNHLQ